MQVDRRAGYTMTQRLDIRADSMNGADAALYADVTDAMGRSDLIVSLGARGDRVVRRQHGSIAGGGVRGVMSEIALRVITALLAGGAFLGALSAYDWLTR
jgi:hypothetical protein